jgi:hypothetical protein
MDFLENIKTDFKQLTGKAQLNIATGMKWKIAQVNQLPKEKEQVLICVNREYHLSTYNPLERVFQVEQETNAQSFSLDNYIVYWTELNDGEPDVIVG